VAKFVKNFYCTRTNLEDKALKEQLGLLSKKMDSISGNFGSTRRVSLLFVPLFENIKLNSSKGN